MPKMRAFSVRRESITRCTPFLRPYMEIKGILHLSDGGLCEGKIVYRNMIASYVDDVGTRRTNVTWFDRDPESDIIYEDRKERQALSEGDSAAI